MWRSICCILFCLVSGLSHAKPVEQIYVDQATALFGEGNYSAALRQFQSLLNSSEDEQLRIRLQWNVARCLEMLGRYEEALSEFYAYQSIINDPQRRTRALRKIEALFPKVYGQLSIECTEAADFQVLHRPTSSPKKVERFGPLPCPNELRELKSGRATVSANFGDKLFEQVVTIEAGSLSTVVLQAPEATKQDYTPWVIGGAVSAVVVATATYLILTADGGGGSDVQLEFQ